MTDLTKLTTPFGLLDPETQEALRKWEHGIESFREGGWKYNMHPQFASAITYRARPAPIVTVAWQDSLVQRPEGE